MSRDVEAWSSALDDPRLRSVLDRLHSEAAGQKLQLGRAVLGMVWDRVRRRRPTVEEQSARMKDLYIPISREQGLFLYLVGRATGARRAVEFGTSFGISILYLAAAVRDNGGGLVVGSEIEPGKLDRARRNVAAAGLEDLVEIRGGDARETLRDPGGTVDLLLLDGWKDLYLPVLEMLAPHLRTGAVVLADNIFTFRRDLRPYVEYVQSGERGFRSLTLPLADGFECSVKIGSARSEPP